MRKTLAYIFAVVLSFYLLVSYWWGDSKAHSREYAGLRVEVKDSARARYLSALELKTYIEKRISMRKGEPVITISTDSIETILSENRLISRVNCYATPSGLIRVDIWQRIPILRVMDGEKSYFIDETGIIIPGPMPVAVHVPVATGNISQEFACTELYDFARFLQKNKFWHAQIAQIYITDKHEVEIIPRVGEHRIVMGDLGNYEEKLNNLRCFYDQALSRCGWNKYHTINLKYKDQIVATRK
ncbi:MAG: cell division protein FtsQ [Coprobacter sp.]|nr:cell division protein FtsQ [Coprobacter sp.]